MSLINTEIKPFKAEAFKQGKFESVSDADVKGKWAIFFFYPADFTFVCPTELEDLQSEYATLKNMGVEGPDSWKDSEKGTARWLETYFAPSFSSTKPCIA